MVVNRQLGGGVKDIRKKRAPEPEVIETSTKNGEKWIKIWIEDSKGDPFYPQAMFLPDDTVKVSTKHAPTMKFKIDERVCIKKKSRNPEKELCRYMYVFEIVKEPEYTIYSLRD